MAAPSCKGHDGAAITVSPFGRTASRHGVRYAIRSRSASHRSPHFACRPHPPARVNPAVRRGRIPRRPIRLRRHALAHPRRVAAGDGWHDGRTPARDGPRPRTRSRALGPPRPARDGPERRADHPADGGLRGRRARVAAARRPTHGSILATTSSGSWAEFASAGGRSKWAKPRPATGSCPMPMPFSPTCAIAVCALHVASGTDYSHVAHEARLLEVDSFFPSGINAPRDNDPAFGKGK